MPWQPWWMSPIGLAPGPPRRSGHPSAMPPGHCLETHGGGGGGGLGCQPRPTHPPTPNQKMLPQANNETYQRGPKFEADFRYTDCLLASERGGGGGISLGNSLNATQFGPGPSTKGKIPSVTPTK